MEANSADIPIIDLTINKKKSSNVSRNEMAEYNELEANEEDQ
jgi:hypothetical protein